MQPASLPAVLCTCALMSFALAACGDDDSGDRAGPGPTTATDTTTTTTPTETTAPEPATSDPVSIERGTTTLNLSPTVGTVLSAVGVELRPIAPARGSGRTVRLPLEPGRVTPGAPDAELRHRGGLEFSAGGGSLRATDLVLAPQREVVTAEVDGRRVTLFDIRGGEPRVVDGVLRYEGVEARLGADIGAALDERLGSVDIPSGLPLGELEVRAELG